MSSTEKYYKVLNEDGTGLYTGQFTWARNGKWMPQIVGTLVQCENGYHLCRREDLIEWLGPVIWEAKANGEVIECGNKTICRRARLIRKLNWNKELAMLFACDCAERVVHLAEDTRCDASIKAGRDYVAGKITKDDLADARAAAWAAVRAVASDAAGDAAWAAAETSAGATARNVAGAAACAAAEDDAWADERQWQTDRLFEYLEGKVTV